MKNIFKHTYEELKEQFDETLNIDKSTYETSNDECTPIGCIEEMLAKIPDSIWTEKVKILDPCCGNGNFHLYAWEKLKSIGRTDKEIVRDNLYFNDINFKRLENVRKIYGDNANLTLFDFLRYPEDEKYDIIYANPPYAKFIKDGEGNYKRASKNHTLVRDFLQKSLNVLKKNGILLFILPDNWMSLADRNRVIKELTEYQFIHLDIHGAKKWFPKVGSSFTWIVMQKKKATQDYTVSCKYRGRTITSTIPGNQRSYIPLLWTKEVQSIVSKTLDASHEKFKVQTSSDLHKYTKKSLISESPDPLEVCRYRFLNKGKKEWKTLVAPTPYVHRLIHTPRTTVWAKRPHKFQDGHKVFISTTDKYKTFVDNCGMTQSIAFIRCEDKVKAENIKEIMDHDLYRFLNNICRWGNFNNIRILQKMPIPKDENDIWGSFGITASEQKFIKENLAK